MTRHAKRRRAFFVEEPIFGDAAAPRMIVSEAAAGLRVGVPHLPAGLSAAESVNAQRELLGLLAEAGGNRTHRCRCQPAAGRL
jgi:UDP-galactopyranose mutase